MLLELLELLATPCPKALRDMGYASELIAIGARRRRCRAAWAEHLARSRRAAVTAIARARSRRTVLVLGSGYLLDIPLAELASAFERVVLVDALHPLAARWAVRRYPNVELRNADIMGAIDRLHTLGPRDELPTPQPFAALHDKDVDLVLSMNLLSQLGVLPVEWIERRQGQAAAAAAEAFAAAATRAHLDDLASCAAAVCLVADVEWRQVRPDGSLVERHSSIYGVPPPSAAEEWIWPIAPAPEDHPTLSEHRRVIVAYDPGKTMPSGPSG